MAFGFGKLLKLSNIRNKKMSLFYWWPNWVRYWPSSIKWRSCKIKCIAKFGGNYFCEDNNNTERMGFLGKHLHLNFCTVHCWNNKYVGFLWRHRRIYIKRNDPKLESPIGLSGNAIWDGTKSSNLVGTWGDLLVLSISIFQWEKLRES